MSSKKVKKVKTVEKSVKFSPDDDKSFIYIDGRRYKKVITKKNKKRFNFSLTYLQSYYTFLRGEDISLATMKRNYEKEDISFHNLNSDGSPVAIDEEDKHNSFIVYGNYSYFLRDTPPTHQEMLDYCNMCITAVYNTANMFRENDRLTEMLCVANGLREKLIELNPSARNIDEAIRGLGLYDNLHKDIREYLRDFVSQQVATTCTISGGTKTKRRTKRRTKSKSKTKSRRYFR